MFLAPTCFSFINNAEETLRYFDDLISTANNHPFGETFFINLLNVEEITVDAVMYLLAIVRNLKSLKAFRIRIIGNSPQDEGCKRIFDDSGFHKFVDSNVKRLDFASSYVRIGEGNKVDPEKAGEIFKFVQYNVNSPHDIYAMIVELMDNTVQHAYNSDKSNQEELSKFTERWYIYAENRDNECFFTFLDTGVGIPATVKRKFLEFNLSDSEYILSALKGENRSQTGEHTRGKGLPRLLEIANNKEIENLVVIAGKGMYDHSQGEVANDLATLFRGTLISWKTKTKCKQEETDVFKNIR